MPSFGAIWKGITGQAGAEAAGQAGAIQAQAMRDLMAQLEPMFAGARTDLDAMYGTVRGDVTGGFDTARTDVTGGYGAARGMLPGMYDEAAAGYAPYTEAGTNALTRLQDPNAFTADPGYAFRLGEGNQAIERAAASGGSRYSGATLKALQRFGQDTASQEYGNWHAREMGLAGMGLTAAGGVSGVRQNEAMARTGLETGEAGLLAQLSAGKGQALASAGMNQAQQRTGLTTAWADALAQITGNEANARAGGVTGAAAARAQGSQNLMNLGMFAGSFFSDRRLKRDIRPLDGAAALALVLRMRPVTWHWLDPETPQAPVGVIAQELAEVAPELVREGPDGYLRVDYGALCGYLLAAVQEIGAPRAPLTTREMYPEPDWKGIQTHAWARHLGPSLARHIDPPGLNCPACRQATEVGHGAD